MGHRLNFEEVEVSGYSEGEARARLQAEAEAIHLEEGVAQANLKGGLDDESSFCHVLCQAPWPRSCPHPLIDHDSPAIVTVNKVTICNKYPPIIVVNNGSGMIIIYINMLRKLGLGKNR